MITVKQILTYFPRKSDDEALFTARLPIVYIQFIKPFLGEAFYNEIKTQYQADTLTTTNDTFLKEYLQPIIAHYAMYSTLALRRAEPSANGILAQLPEFGQDPTATEVGLSTNNILAAAESLVKEARNFLKCSNEYPLYKCGTEDITGNIGIYLGESYNQVNMDKNR